jgi:hypothetical protein
VIIAAPLAYVLFSDTLCPEHRMWVQLLGSVAIVSAVASVVGLIRGWPVAPALTCVSAALGVVIGVIDMVHDPQRGALVAAGFAAAFLVSVLLLAGERQAQRWDRSVEASTPPTEVIQDLELALAEHDVIEDPATTSVTDEVEEPAATDRD